VNLFPYQQQGVQFLMERRRAYLADQMGLGKTVQALAAARLLKLEKVLVIAPASTLPNWRREAEEWGTPGWGFSAISYADRRLRDNVIHGSDWDVVIIDEAHYVKNRKAKRTNVVLRVASSAPRAWLLSGTPMPNDPTELWTVFDALWPELLDRHFRSYHHWLTHFCRFTATAYGIKIWGVKNSSTLRWLLRKVMLRRKLEDVDLELPPLRVTLSTLPKPSNWELTTEEEATLRRIEREEQVDGSMSRIRRLLGQLKAPLIAHQIAHEIHDREYDKIVVLYHHTTVGDIFAKELKKYGVVRVDGSSAPAHREDAELKFRTDANVRVFLGQQISAGTGLNLQAASEIVLVEPSWTPDENRQAIKRIHRIGQDKPCRARVFGVEGTLDEAVMKTLARKTTMQEEVGVK